ncbi:hypothetical protein FKG94_09045 [Exilibacterium tricleocarpae]|uniref:Urease accessory protein UreH-like transmembrane domain-containing protein n=1 Tax=Exilibacterium tricleocarpae TaxID=2591008 RepID=A0A545TVJ2_9GAMM|nr:sulfite exporter TauE/SafE family protein [Exilibacterium tricleocarpae]TQV81238.1 hypothetical protein FKG94_09045 [Exilibacterium tricleocarpae]
MTPEIQILIVTAATIAFVHTLLGPDHYLPFAVMARARGWSLRKVTGITLVCGLGHIVGSIVLGFVGVALGTAIATLEWIETVRGELAAWGLIAFGLVYLAWGLRRAHKGRPHSHLHAHGDLVHSHAHNHHGEHAHVHTADDSKSLTPWAIFLIFVLGPCEPLIPLLMYPAARESMLGVVLVTATFGLVTVVTMLGAVILTVWGLQRVKVPGLARFGHALAGGTVLVCGVSIHLVGH